MTQFNKQQCLDVTTDSSSGEQQQQLQARIDGLKWAWERAERKVKESDVAPNIEVVDGTEETKVAKVVD